MKLNSDDFERIKDNINDGTSFEGMVVNKFTGERGYLKVTGSMLGIYNEDINEFLSCMIMKELGFLAPDIDLIEYDEQDAWVSYDLLEDGDIAYDLEFSYYKGEEEMDHESIFVDYMNSLYECCSKLGSEQDRIFGEIVRVLFMDCLLDNCDFKSNNFKIAMDENHYPKRVMCYDYGVAFNENAIQRNGIFHLLQNDEIMTYLVKYYPNELNDLVENIRERITPGFINSILDREECSYIDKNVYFNVLINNIIEMNSIIDSEEINLGVSA